MRNEKGITLIALILAILVLVVLAGISVSLMLSNEDEGKVVTNNNIDDSVFPDSDIYENIEDSELDNVDSEENVLSGIVGNEDIINENTVESDTTVEGNVVNNTEANTVR